MKAIMLLCLIFISCASEPESIFFGEDGCKNCMMTITDQRYAALLWTDKSKTYKFDSIECVADYFKKKSLTQSDIKAIHVPDFFQPNMYINYTDAVFVIDSVFQSPMGLNIAAIQEMKKNSFFETYDWPRLVAYVEKKWSK